MITAMFTTSVSSPNLYDLIFIHELSLKSLKPRFQLQIKTIEFVGAQEI